MVNAHGCAMYSPVKAEAGLPVQFKRKEGRATMAYVVDCQPMGSGQQGWQLGAEARPARETSGDWRPAPKTGYNWSMPTLPESPQPEMIMAAIRPDPHLSSYATRVHN